MTEEPELFPLSPGAALRRLRESRGLTLDAAAEATHVRVRYLEALEQEDIGALLGPAYAKSFLKAYARFLEADPDTIDEYRAMLGAGTPVPIPEEPPPPPRNRLRVWWIGACVVIVSGGVLLALRRTPAADQTTPGVARVVSPVDSGAPYFESPAPVVDSLIVQGGQPMLPADTLSSLQIVAVDSTWVEVSVDGQMRLHELLMPGEVRIIDASAEYRLTLGNAGGVELTLNGERLPSPGPLGMVIRNMIIDARRKNPGT